MDAAREPDASIAASPASDKPVLRALLPAPPAGSTGAAAPRSPKLTLKQELSPHAEALALLGDGFVTPPRDAVEVADHSGRAAAGSYATSTPASSVGSKRSFGDLQSKQGAGRRGLAGDGEEGRASSKRVYGDRHSRRKSSGDFLRKGQWTSTEERLARALIEAFEEGYLPVYTGIRLRGYLAVQLQCDPMRISKKLCTGNVDGLVVPKNFGQKKFKLRMKANWDRDEANRVISTLEKLTNELWREAPVPRPPFLTLSSTRNSEEPLSLRELSFASCMSPESPGRRLSPTVTRKHKSTVFPIIYLNLSKKHNKKPSDRSDDTGSVDSSSSSDSDAELTESTTPIMSEDEKAARRPRKQRKTKPLDGESLQAAYDLLTLCKPATPTNKGKKCKRKNTKPKASKSKCEIPAALSPILIKSESEIPPSQPPSVTTAP